MTDDIGALRPTFFAGVPRVFERIHAGVLDQVCVCVRHNE
jgi:long-subunit acyl-CoA synthetase (AMP-forming)